MPETTPQPAEKAIVQDGQVLKRQPRQRKKATKKASTKSTSSKTLEEVAAKHADPPPAAPDPEDTVGDEEKEAIATARTLSRQLTLTEAEMPEEITEPRPERRQGPTLTVEIPDESDGKIAALEDIMGRYPIGESDYYVQVERKAPKSFEGMQCHGRQRPLTRPLTYEKFVEEYGGGDYLLRVYGPPRRGTGLYDPTTGRPRPVKLSGDVKLVVPWDMTGRGGHAPNPESSLLESELQVVEDDMQDRMDDISGALAIPRRRGPASHADAKMFDSSLAFRQQQIDRDDRRADAARRQMEQDRRMEQGTVNQAVSGMQDLMLQAMKATREDAQRQRDEMREREQSAREEAREREARIMEMQKEKGELSLNGIAELIKSLKDDGDSQQQTLLLENARSEVLRIQESHRLELERVQQAREQERVVNEERARSIQERADARIKEAEQRAAERIKDVEDRIDRRLAEEERRWQRQVTEAKEDARREREMLDRNYNSRIDDERRQRERDLESRQVTQQATESAHKVAHEAEVRQLKNEIERMNREMDRLRADLEKKGNLVEQMKEFEELAGQMGMSRGEGGPTSWKDDLIRVGMELIPNLGGIISSGGDAVAKLRGQQLQPGQPMPEQGVQAYQVRQQPMASVGGEPLAFATDDGGFAGSGELGPPIPKPMEFAVPPMESYGWDQPPAAEPAPVSPSTAPPAPSVPPAPAAGQPAPAPVPAAAPAPVAAEPTVPAEPSDFMISEEDIMKFVPMLSKALAETPESAVSQLAEVVPPEVMLAIAQSINPPRVADVIMRRMPEYRDSQLVKRSGQAWMRRVQQLIMSQIQ